MSITVTLLSGGSPDPAWTLTGQEEEAFLQRLGALSTPNVTVGPPSRRPGYSGLLARDDQGSHWTLYRGWVRGGAVTRVDESRALERWLLETGRASLPPALMEEMVLQVAPRT